MSLAQTRSKGLFEESPDSSSQHFPFLRYSLAAAWPSQLALREQDTDLCSEQVHVHVRVRVHVQEEEEEEEEQQAQRRVCFRSREKALLCARPLATRFLTSACYMHKVRRVSKNRSK